MSPFELILIVVAVAIGFYVLRWLDNNQREKKQKLLYEKAKLSDEAVTKAQMAFEKKTYALRSLRMYIRWQSRKLTKNTFWRKRGDVHWRAILVESMRIDGKPTQRHVAYLGGITKSNIAADSPTQRVFFWNTVEDNLSALKLSTKERAAITQAIAKKIPHVTGRQRKQVERRQREILGE